jgi:hypothetical protein
MILLLSLLISFGASAKTYLVPCVDDNTKACQIKTSQVPKNVICERPDAEFDGDGSIYEINIVEVPDGFFGNLLDLIGLGTSRPWGPGEVIADNEKIVCTIDTDKKQAKIDAKAAFEAAEKAKKDKRKSDWDALCAAPKAGLEAILCEERGY